MKKSARITVTLADVQAARQELKKHLPVSPLLYNAWLSDRYGCELYLKLDNMLPIGSFKIRGATYRISRLTAAERRRGVIAASAGNHAQGVAWGARELGTTALIVMPRTAPLMKVQNTRALGAEVRLEGENYDEAYAAATRLARKTGRVFVHAFRDRDVIAGQGTAALEILEQLPDVDYCVGSIGGGGWMAGTAVVLQELRPQARIYGCQAAGAPSMLESLRRRRPVTLKSVETFADGIAVKEASEPMRRLLQDRLAGVLSADDEAIAAAILTLIEKAKVVAEGAGALPLAVLDQIRKPIRGKKVVLLVSGGNIDVNVLSRIIDRGLIRAGRRIRVNVLVSDRPGSLARLTALIAEQGANIIQAIHDRSEPSTHIDQTEVALTLETKGEEHSAAVIAALREHALRVDVVS